MAKELLIYNGIYGRTAAEFIKEMNTLNSTDELCVRVSTPGGNPEYAFSMAAKYKEFKGKKKVKADGGVHSSGLFFLCYTPKEDTECLDVTQFTLHRAAYPSFMENNPDFFTEDTKASLSRVNNALRSAFASRVDVEMFETKTGKTLDEVFSMEDRINVTFGAELAEEIGLVGKVTRLTPEIEASIYGDYSLAANTEIKTNSKMNIQKLKSEHPELYAEVLQLGVKQEKDRVEACLVFLEDDPKGVKAAIESGENLSAKQMAEFSRKAASAAALASIEDDNADDADTDELDDKQLSAEQKELAAFEAEIDKHLKK